jgi:NET1-associated nuclear protein 1 (U3 small nucleolar RNA-associated protein 17)
MKLSPTSPSLVWVACANGFVGSIDWTTGLAGGATLSTGLSKTTDIDVASMAFGQTQADVIFSAGSGADQRAQVVLCPGGYGRRAEPHSVYTDKEPGSNMPIIRSSIDGSLLFVAAGESLVVLALKTKDASSPSRLLYKSYHFDTKDIICSLDIRICMPAEDSVMAAKKERQVVDLIAGGARGGIYIYRDILGKLEELRDQGLKKEALVPKVYHWHRRAVHALKWSQDGMESRWWLSETSRTDFDSQAVTCFPAVLNVFWFSGKWTPPRRTFFLTYSAQLKISLCRLRDRLFCFTWTIIQR